MLAGAVSSGPRLLAGSTVSGASTVGKGALPPDVRGLEAIAAGRSKGAALLASPAAAVGAEDEDAFEGVKSSGPLRRRLGGGVEAASDAGAGADGTAGAEDGGRPVGAAAAGECRDDSSLCAIRGLA